MGREECSLCCRQVLDLVICAVKGRSYEVIHSGIHDKEVLGLSALYKKYTGNQGCALSYKRTSRLHMNRLIFTSEDVC